MHRLFIPVLMVCLSTPASAQDLQDDLPNIDYDDAVNCLAYRTASLEQGVGDRLNQDATAISFWAKVVAAKQTPAVTGQYTNQFTASLTNFRENYAALTTNPVDSAAWRDADENLTMMGKMCWYQAETLPGIGPFAD